MTSALHELLATTFAGILEGIGLDQILAPAEPAETGSLVRGCLWTILLRYSLALLHNVFAGASAFAGLLGRLWSLRHGGPPARPEVVGGAAITTAQMSRAVSGYGRVDFVGSIYYVLGRKRTEAPGAAGGRGDQGARRVTGADT